MRNLRCYTVVCFPSRSCNNRGIAFLEPHELIESRIRVHDGNQFELKLDYALDRDRALNYYQIESYFFVPRSLGIEPHTYSREQFYSDVQAYIRFKTPTMSLASLADEDDQASILARIEAVMQQTVVGRQPERDAFTRDLQLLACLVRVRVRDRCTDLCRKVTDLGDHAQARAVLAEDIRTGILRLLEGVDLCTDRFRRMRRLFMQPELPPWMGELYALVDEYISASIESYLTMLIAGIDAQQGVRQFLGAPRDATRNRVLSERRHREHAGYSASVLSTTGTNDAYVHRYSQLKKFMSSVLFLEIRKAKGARHLTNLLAGLAAGIAMLFSTVIAVWTHSEYGLRSISFVVAAVVTYIFKDRIKEWLRTYFNNMFTRRLFDYNTTIVDPATGARLGRCRESFTYLDPTKVPLPILQQRHADASGVLEPESKPEVVLKYVKNVTISRKKVAASPAGSHDINDIIRFNIGSFLPRMDDPVRELDVFDAELDRVTKIPCPKTYHVNVLLVLKAQRQTASTLRFRVVLDRGGIRHLQDVRPQQPVNASVESGVIRLFGRAAVG